MIQRVAIEDFSLDQYEAFLSAKQNPIHRVVGNVVEYEVFEWIEDGDIPELAKHLFDYQVFIVILALKRRRFAVFADVGLGKTAIFLEWVRIVSKWVYPKKVLIISPLHVIRQTLEEQMKFYSWNNIADINAEYDGSIEKWAAVKNTRWAGSAVGIVNVDKFRTRYRLSDEVGAVVLDESSILKNATGKLRTNIIESCVGIPFKLACSATPAPNDRQEYANHALFLEYIDNWKQFFTKYFVNTGSGNDFVLKPHAKRAFYEFLASWSVFLKNPKNYGFEDNLHDLMPPEFVWERVPLTKEQYAMATAHCSKGQMHMFSMNVGGVGNRTKASQISKGFIYE